MEDPTGAGSQHPDALLVEELRSSECVGLLATSRFGRLAVIGLDGAPDVFPMNHAAGDGCLYLRSAPGTKLAAIHEHPAVAYEVDGADGEWRWSVVVRGNARRLDRDDEIEASGVLELRTDSPIGKWDYVRVDLGTLTGRRFRVG